MNEENNTDSLSAELKKLGSKVHEALEAAASSPELKAVKTELGDSFGRIGDKIMAAAKKAEESAEKNEIKEQAKKVAQAGIRATTGIQKNLAVGLREVSERLADLAKKLDEPK